MWVVHHSAQEIEIYPGVDNCQTWQFCIYKSLLQVIAYFNDQMDVHFWFCLIFQVTIGIPNIYICQQHLFLYDLDSKIVESNCRVFIWWELKFLFHKFFPRSNPRGWNVIYVMNMNFLILLLAQLKTYEIQ